MSQEIVKIGNLNIGNSLPFVLFGGMNVLESRDMAMQVAEAYVKVTQKLGIPYVFKASFDKANRQSSKSFRGPGMNQALKSLDKIKSELGCAFLTDVHETIQVEETAKYAEVIQIPAFLSRQTKPLQPAKAEW